MYMYGPCDLHCRKSFTLIWKGECDLVSVSVLPR